MDQAWILSRSLPLKLITTQKVPSWSSLNSRQMGAAMRTEIGYCPLWSVSPTEPSTVYSVMFTVKAMMVELEQRHAVITFDQAIYKVAKEIQWKRPDEFQNMVVRLGGFHILLNFLGTIGKMCASSGLAELITEAAIYSDSTTSSVLKGKQYKRGVRIHKLVHESLARLEWVEFEQFIANHEDPAMLNCLSDLQDLALQTSDACQLQGDELRTILNNMQTSTASLSQLFQQHRQYLCDKSQLANFWLCYMEAVELMLAFIRAEREQNWELHLGCVHEMASYFFAFDRQNYSRWIGIYLSDMFQLREAAPEVDHAFKEGMFGVNRSDKGFASVWTDMALEQSLNADVKSSGGLNHVTKREAARDRWFINNHIQSIITAQMSEMCRASIQTASNQKHAEDTVIRTALDEKSVTDITNTLTTSMKNPFTIDQAESPNPLSNIATGAKPPKKSAELIVNARLEGQVRFNEFIEKRLFTNTEEFLAPIPRLKVPSFSGKKKKSKAKQKTNSINSDRALFARLIIAAQSRKIDLPSLFKHELAEFPLSLAQADGEMRKGNKAQLMNALEGTITSTYEITPKTNHNSSAYIIDGMACIQKMKGMNVKSFGEYARELLTKIVRHFKSCSRVDVVFDRYDGTQSIKCGERNKREKARGGDILIHSAETPFPSWNTFISNEGNKIRLVKFLTDIWLAEAGKVLQPGTELIIGGGFVDARLAYKITSSEASICDELKSDQEEADTRMILHAAHAFRTKICVTISSPDTDVLLIAAYHFPSFCLDQEEKEMWFHTGVGIHDRLIPIHR